MKSLACFIVVVGLLQMLSIEHCHCQDPDDDVASVIATGEQTDDGPVSNIDIHSPDDEEIESPQFLDRRRSCDIVCTADYRPVCGRLIISGQKIFRTFSNACWLGIVNCQNPDAHYRQVTRHSASCEQLGLYSRCSTACNFAYRPICGERDPEGLRTFPNECLFWNANCKSPNHQWRKVRHGECSRLPRNWLE